MWPRLGRCVFRSADKATLAHDAVGHRRVELREGTLNRRYGTDPKGRSRAREGSRPLPRASDIGVHPGQIRVGGRSPPGVVVS